MAYYTQGFDTAEYGGTLPDGGKSAGHVQHAQSGCMRNQHNGGSMWGQIPPY